jgi:FkbM family methyltransferase
VNRELNSPYLLAFSKGKSDYEDWITLLDGSDENGRLLMKLLGGTGTLLDIGANIETISVPVAQSGSSVMAVEIIPANCLKLWTSGVANNLTNLEIIQAAASDIDGLLNYRGEEVSGAISADGKGPQALCLRVDSILAHAASVAEPLIFKIDVEGYESAVLVGARARSRNFDRSCFLRRLKLKA